MLQNLISINPEKTFGDFERKLNANFGKRVFQADNPKHIYIVISLGMPI